MCGIACFVGENAAMLAFGALEKLEYRGYDSAGMATLNDKNIEVYKRVGGVKNILSFAKITFSRLAISHTRWATHGEKSERNAHPHLSFDNNYALAHNGIIENWEELKAELIKKGIPFLSETDTEVAINLIASMSGDTLHKISAALSKIVGSYAFAILDRAGEKIYATRLGSPLYLAKFKEGYMLSSDIVCFNGAEGYYSLCEGEIVEVSPGGFKVFSPELEEKSVSLLPLEKTISSANLSGFSHYMEKEIYEIPEVIRRIEREYYGGEKLEKIRPMFEGVERVFLVGCGTAYHACLVGERLIEEKLHIAAQAFIASELKYREVVAKNSLAIFVSQSGETADTIGCQIKLKAAGAKTLGLTNNDHSTLTRNCDQYLNVMAGAEIAVASTKAYVAQVVVLTYLANFLSGKATDLSELCLKTKEVIKIDKEIVELISKNSSVFFIGRGQDSITALEAALKLKEISYIKAEGYPAGELKHGTIALIEKDTPVVVFSTDEKLHKKTMSSALEAKSRGAKIILVSPFSGGADYKISLPRLKEKEQYLALSIIPFQLMSYLVSLRLNYNPDQPRNLAKSVTVE